MASDNKVFVTTWTGSNDKLIFDFSKFPVISILSDENTTNKNRSIILNLQGAKTAVSDEATNIIITQSIDGNISIESIGLGEE